MPARLPPDPDTLSPDALARLVELAEDAIVSVDEGQRIVQFNRGAEKVFGYRADEAIGRPLAVLLPDRYAGTHDRDVTGFATGSAAARAMGDRRRVFGRRKDGTEFPAEVSIARVRDGDRLVLSAIVRDVTERAKIEAEIRALNAELEARVAARTAELEASYRQLARKSEENETFVYSVSHDLRSPLVNLEGFSRELVVASRDLAAVLADPAVPPGVRDRAAALIDGDMAEAIGYIQAAVVRLSGIIDALLRLSRAGRVQYEARAVDVAAVVGRVVQAARGTMDAKGAGVTVGPLPPAWADPQAVEQVFANLIGNALNYLAPGRLGRVEVGVLDPALDPALDEPADPPGVHTYFVRDNGVGIPAAHAGQVFHAFRRLQPGLAAGEGMGLVLVRRILDRLGGAVRFESADGAGTTFTVTLPAAPGAGEPRP